MSDTTVRICKEFQPPISPFLSKTASSDWIDFANVSDVMARGDGSSSPNRPAAKQLL